MKLTSSQINIVMYIVFGILIYFILARLKIFKLAGGLENIFTSDVKDTEQRIEIQRLLSGDFWGLKYWETAPGKDRFSWGRATELAEKIKQSFGFFNDNEPAIVSVFKELRTKAHLSQVATVYFEKYGKRLENVLAANLTNNELLVLSKIVDQLR